MIRLRSIILSIVLIACSTYGNDRAFDKAEIIKTIFQHALQAWEGCLDCKIKYVFLGSDEVDINQEFLSAFNYKELEFLNQESASSNCETGLTYKGIDNRGYAFSVFAVRPVSDRQVEVEWGHWYSCKSYSYKISKLSLDDSKWRIISTENRGKK